mmetsp:Transcript_3130/g.12413  ORF Transcript_3130/g.12413 Transcript_3130/m.12413 type:complete len:450 (-) Transcript_3130:325-1674(-)
MRASGSASLCGSSSAWLAERCTATLPVMEISTYYKNPKKRPTEAWGESVLVFLITTFPSTPTPASRPSSRSNGVLARVRRALVRRPQAERVDKDLPGLSPPLSHQFLHVSQQLGRVDPGVQVNLGSEHPRDVREQRVVPGEEVLAHLLQLANLEPLGILRGRPTPPTTTFALSLPPLSLPEDLVGEPSKETPNFRSLLLRGHLPRVSGRVQVAPAKVFIRQRRATPSEHQRVLHRAPSYHHPGAPGLTQHLGRQRCARHVPVPNHRHGQQVHRETHVLPSRVARVPLRSSPGMQRDEGRAPRLRRQEVLPQEPAVVEPAAELDRHGASGPGASPRHRARHRLDAVRVAEERRPRAFARDDIGGAAAVEVDPRGAALAREEPRASLEELLVRAHELRGEEVRRARRRRWCLVRAYVVAMPREPLPVRQLVRVVAGQRDAPQQLLRVGALR